MIYILNVVIKGLTALSGYFALWTKYPKMTKHVTLFILTGGWYAVYLGVKKHRDKKKAKKESK